MLSSHTYHPAPILQHSFPYDVATLHFLAQVDGSMQQSGHMCIFKQFAPTKPVAVLDLPLPARRHLVLLGVRRGADGTMVLVTRTGTAEELRQAEQRQLELQQTHGAAPRYVRWGLAVIVAVVHPSWCIHGRSVNSAISSYGMKCTICNRTAFVLA